MTRQAGDQQQLLKVYGQVRSAAAYAIRDFLHRCDVPFEFVPLNDRDAPCQPVCEFPDGTRMEGPSIREITEKLGWFRNPSRTEYELAIYGGGPAGLSAAVYGAADGLKTILVERWAVGGQAATTSKIENYLGFPEGISGAELAERAREQACKFGVDILMARAGVRAEFPPGKGVGYLEDGTRVVARASICATGVAYRRLQLPDESRFFGAGLYYGAAASEAPLTRDEHVVVVGGGNSGGQAAMHFSAYASKVTMAVRGDSLKSSVSQYLIDRIHASPRIEVLTRTEVKALHGKDSLEQVTLVNNVTGEERCLATRWLFVCIGGDPQTGWAGPAGVVCDEGGYLVTGSDLLRRGERPAGWPLDRDPYPLETSVPGVFAAGDVRHGSVKRCASAVGEGAMAVGLVNKYLTGG
jgi:thioredoxin reductase (NADPH)